MGDAVLSEETNRSENINDSSFEYQQHYYENLSKDMLELWFKQLKSEETCTQKNRLTNGVTPFLAIPTTVVEVIFYICEEFQQPCEVRYLTVEIFDRFINNQFLIIAPKIWQYDINNYTIFENVNWKQISDRIKNQSLLRIMSCVAIASKFVQFSKVVPIKKIQEFLHKSGQTFSTKTILASEMRVFKTLDYKLHFPNVLTHTDLLIELIDLPKHIEKKLIHKISIKVIDMTYLHHQEIYHKLFYYSTGRWEKTSEERKEFHSTECNNLFLAAAIIVTTMTIIQPENVPLANEMAIKLDRLTSIPLNDIIALASIITMIILT